MAGSGSTQAGSTTTAFDAIVVGAGFAGMYALHRLRALGLSVRVLEAASGVGGTWFWNRYPGARCDVESVDYSYSFDDALQQEWRWTERYATQPEILRYLNHVADRFDLRRDIQLDTTVEAVVYDDATGRWTVTGARGERFTARFCVMASGVLSKIKTPDIPGFDTFAGETFHTARWPHEGVDFTGQRVAVIGTGSTGVQAIPQIAEAAKHLYVFQRTPNFSIPARNRLLEDDYVEQIKASYAERREESRWSVAGVPGDPPERSALGTPEEERLQIYERGWQVGGGPAILRSFSDLMVDLDANDTAANFVRQKIRQLVEDPAVAEALTPTDHPLGAKRICVDTNYYATYNRDNVTLINVRETPIEEIVPAGVRTSEALVEVDALVLAIGFDAISGALLNIDMRGRDGVRLSDQWLDGPRTYLGLMTAGFPNLFSVVGPGSPSVLGNVVSFIEQHVDWITDCIAYLQDEHVVSIEPMHEAQEAWVTHVNEVAAQTLYPLANSWFVGANIPGKPRTFLPYAGGLGKYRDLTENVARRGYQGFVLTREDENLPSAASADQEVLDRG